MHRSIPLLTTMGMLVFVTAFLWNRHFTPDLTKKSVHLSAGNDWVAPGSQQGGTPVRMPLASLHGSAALHLTFQLECQQLVKGPRLWDNGRLHLELFRNGKLVERKFLGSAWGHGPSEQNDFIIQLPQNSDMFLHLENLGLSGHVRLKYFHAVPVTTSSAISLPLLFFAWLIWAAAFAGPLGRLRSWLAGTLWLLFAYFTIVPGPWPYVKPLLGEFTFLQSQAPIQKNHGSGSLSATSAQSVNPSDRKTMLPATLNHAPFTAASSYPEEIPIPNLLLRVKIYLQPLRPLLHSLLFFLPSFLLLVLVPRRTVILMATSLALLVETTEWGFGYGFDKDDIIDLLTDALGIAAAVLAHLLLVLLCRKYAPRKILQVHNS